jgi:hypothetical protein
VVPELPLGLIEIIMMLGWRDSLLLPFRVLKACKSMRFVDMLPSNNLALVWSVAVYNNLLANNNKIIRITETFISMVDILVQQTRKGNTKTADVIKDVIKAYVRDEIDISHVGLPKCSLPKWEALSEKDRSRVVCAMLKKWQSDDDDGWVEDDDATTYLA